MAAVNTIKRKLYIEPNEINLSFQATYSCRRRTVGISVKAPGEICVRAPVGISDAELIRIVSSKAAWILKQQRVLREAADNVTRISWSSGDELLLQGERYRLEIRVDKSWRKPEIVHENGIILIRTASDDRAYLRRLMLQWYGRQATAKITGRLQYYAALLNLKPGDIRVKNQKSRWGSCSGGNNLNFNWRLVMAPEKVMDYVIIHELCHIRIKNHSDKFWRMVARFMPDYAQQRQWLRKNGHLLEI